VSINFRQPASIIALCSYRRLIRKQIDPDGSGDAVIEKAEEEQRGENEQEENGKWNKPEGGAENNQHFYNRHAVAHIHGTKKIARLFVEFVIAHRTVFVHFRNSQQKNIPF